MALMSVVLGVVEGSEEHLGSWYVNAVPHAGDLITLRKNPQHYVVVSVVWALPAISSSATRQDDGVSVTVTVLKSG